MTVVYDATTPPAPPCSIHRYHAPAHLTVEEHHVVPVAWQLATHVENPPFPGVDPDGRGELWDARVVTLCPTGHRSVHFLIVTLMHSAAKGAGPEQAVALLPRHHRRMPEATIALDALVRYEPFGTLLALTQEGLWGEA